MNEEQFTMHDEKELFEELSKDKGKRSDILINLNIALQKYQNIVANIKGIREIQEYKIAVVTIENELQKVQQKNQQLKEQLNKYTDPKDLTLMFMYCDEKAKDKIKCLEQENQQLKEQIEKCQLQNFNLKQDIMIKKISFPNKKIRDKSLIELYNMPSYEDLKRENQQLKEQLDQKEDIINKAKENLQKHLNAKNYGNHKYELFGREYLEELLEILDNKGE